MYIYSKTSIATITAILMCGSSYAQDSETTEVGPWTGAYVGGSLGYDWQPNDSRERNETISFDTNGDGRFGDSVTTIGGADAFSPGFCRGAGLGNSAAGGCRGDRDGKAGWSVHAGYDYQMGSIVIGGVIEGGRSNLRNSVTGFSTTPAAYTMTRHLDWSAAARLRAGFALPSNTLIYATGGVAYGKFENSFSTTNSFNSFTERNRKEEDWGWVVGGGIDQKISDNFSIGVLYKYTRFNPNEYSVTAGQGTPPSATNPFVITPAGQTVFMRSNDRFTTQDVRVTASFRF